MLLTHSVKLQTVSGNVMTRPKNIFLIGFIFLTTCLIGQEKRDTLYKFYSFPIVRDTKGNYPKQIEVEGKITSLTTGVSCGVMCGCGTIKILLTTKVKHYNQDNVYVAIQCFSVNYEDYINKTIKIKLKLLEKTNKDCYWNEAPSNSIDSQGTPFYIPDNLDAKLNIK